METQEPKPTRYFYPRSPCGERPTASRRKTTDMRFLSTLSLRRATTYGTRIVSRYTNFYPRSPCGERPIIFCKLLDSLVISIHALLAESDLGKWDVRETPPLISIHALLAESDTARSLFSIVFPKFLSTLSLRRATRQQES